MTTINSKTILRSRNAAAPDKVLSTLLLRYPRCIHAEFMTHRMFSRNAASSRAIPVEKLIADVLADPFVPLVWGANQKGMQGGANHDARIGFNGDSSYFTREDYWLHGMRQAVEMARAFSEAGYHKQIVNRLLEPFSHITVVVSATEWSNFLALRDHPDAEPHIAILAREIRKCLDNDPIQELQPGEWHTPFVPKSEWSGNGNPLSMGQIIGKSVACCASTSYKTVEGFDMTLDRAVALHDKLVASTPLHASPCEHVAQADALIGPDIMVPNAWNRPEEHGNFTGFRQYRKQIPGESL